MGLPYFQSENRNMSLLQTAWTKLLNPLLANPLMQGQLITNVALASGTTQVNHKLGRPPQGWFLVAPLGAATVYQGTQNTPSLTLALVSSAAITTDIYVF